MFSQPAVTHPAILLGNNFNVGHLDTDILMKLFHIYHGPLPFYMTFTGLSLVWGHKINRKKICFLTQFVTDQDKIWCGDEATQVEHSDITAEGGLFIQGSQNMHSPV